MVEEISKTSPEILERIAERLDARRRRYAIDDVGIEHLEESAFTSQAEFSQGDVEKAKSFILESAPFAHPKVFPDYWEHVLLTSIYAKKLALKVNSSELKPIEAEGLGFMHDIGRLDVPDKYYRTTIVDKLMEKAIGIKADLTEKLPPIARILGIKEPVVNTIQGLSLPQIILDISDNFGKRGKDGTLFSKDQMKQYVFAQFERYKKAKHTSERVGLKKLERDGRQEVATDLVFAEIAWLQNEYGVDFDALRDEVWQEFNSKENQDWILRVKNSQESLNLAVDEVLKRPGINTVVFDFGDVLCEAPDEKLIANLANKFACSPEDISRAFAEHNGPSMGGKISEKEYLERFYQSVGRKMPESIQDARVPFIQPQIYRPVEGMQEVLKKLWENPNVKIYVLSDAIRPLAGIIREMIAKYYPEIDQENIFISSEIGESKREKGAPAFQKMIDMLKERGIDLDPQSTLFIDDREKYTTATRTEYGIRGLTFRGDETRTPSERFIGELSKAGLI